MLSKQLCKIRIQTSLTFLVLPIQKSSHLGSRLLTWVPVTKQIIFYSVSCLPAQDISNIGHGQTTKMFSGTSSRCQSQISIQMCATGSGRALQQACCSERAVSPRLRDAAPPCSSSVLFWDEVWLLGALGICKTEEAVIKLTSSRLGTLILKLK